MPLYALENQKLDAYHLVQALHQEMDRRYRPDDPFVCHAAIFKPNGFDTCYLDPKSGQVVPLRQKVLAQAPFFQEIWEQIDLQEADSYMSINSFVYEKRRARDIRHLNGFLLDYDFYKMEAWSQLSPQQMYEEHIRPTLPLCPSAVLDSGRGLYVLYLFQHAPKAAAGLYKAIYKAMLASQAPFGMDSKAMLETQLMRIPGTRNSRSGKLVQILETHETHYTLQDLTVFLPCPRPTRSRIRKQRPADRTPGNHAAPCTRREHLALFLQDLKTLIGMRKGKMSGWREYVLYLIWERMLWCGHTAAQIIETAHAFNALFTDPLTDYAVEKQARPPEGYLFVSSREKVITRLEMSEEEQGRCRFLKGRKIRDRLAKRRKRSLQKYSRQEGLRQRRVALVQWMEQRISRKILWERYEAAFHCSRKTFQRDLEYIRTHRREFQTITNRFFLRSLEPARTAGQMGPDKPCLRNDSVCSAGALSQGPPPPLHLTTPPPLDWRRRSDHGKEVQ